jgi:putative multicomponent Na+:H+ antiporter subunit B
MDSYIYVLTALLPLAAAMVVLQVNPYHALVIRGILGAVAVMVYAVLGAADVSLTEALVGTLLAITLYAVAVRSSLVLRLGVLKNDLSIAEHDRERESEHENKPETSLQSPQFQQCLSRLRRLFKQYHMRVELVPYQSQSDLQQGLINQEVHATCAQTPAHLPNQTSLAQADLTQPKSEAQNQPEPEQIYFINTRLRRIHEILQPEWMSSTTLINTDAAEFKEVQS